jgi:hypothetical protein
MSTSEAEKDKSTSHTAIPPPLLPPPPPPPPPPSLPPPARTLSARVAGDLPLNNTGDDAAAAVVVVVAVVAVVFVVFVVIVVVVVVVAFTLGVNGDANAGVGVAALYDFESLLLQSLLL